MEMEQIAMFDCSPTYVEQPLASPKSTEKGGKGALMTDLKDCMLYVIFLCVVFLFSRYMGIMFILYVVCIIPFRALSHDWWFRR